jgi:hypothetical protein
MWTLVRAVELKSFKVFDDSVSSLLVISEGFLLSMTNHLIHFTQTISTIKEFPNKIIGFVIFGDFVYIASKTITSISIYQATQNNLDRMTQYKSFNLSDSCSAFYSQVQWSTFWIGLRDGSISSYSLETKNLRKMVSLLISNALDFSTHYWRCHSGNLCSQFYFISLR